MQRVKYIIPIFSYEKEHVTEQHRDLLLLLQEYGTYTLPICALTVQAKAPSHHLRIGEFDQHHFLNVKWRVNESYSTQQP